MNEIAKRLLINVAVSAGMATVSVTAHMVKKHVVAPAKQRAEVKRDAKQLVKETEEFLQYV